VKNGQLWIWSKHDKWFSCEKLIVRDLIKAWWVILMCKIDSWGIWSKHNKWFSCEKLTAGELYCFDKISNCQFITWESLIFLWSNPQLSIFHKIINCIALIKSSAVNFSHKNHLYYFDHIPSCQFFTWELLVMPNPPTVNFTHENHSSCFDQIPNYQFFTWESLIMLRSNPQLSEKLTAWGFDQSNINDSHAKNWQLGIWSK
jgi:hypothetical protein